MQGACSGQIASGRKGRRYSDTTLAGYQRSWDHAIGPEFGHRPGSEITEAEWQAWANGLARQGLSRSRIANHLAVASAIYRWASRPTRRGMTGVTANPIRGLELPGAPEVPRLRVAPAAEAEQLLAALDPDDQVPFALAFYAGLRRGEIERLDWADVELEGYRLTVGRSKSEAGTMRRPPIAEPLRPLLLRAHLRAGRPKTGPVSPVSVTSGKLQRRADHAWADRGLVRVTLHECRHTYASFLMAAGYTLKELMEYMGHADLQMVQRYVKLLPQPDERPRRAAQYVPAAGSHGIVSLTILSNFLSNSAASPL